MFKSRARERDREKALRTRNDPNLTACMRLGVNQTGCLPELAEMLSFSPMFSSPRSESTINMGSSKLDKKCHSV